MRKRNKLNNQEAIMVIERVKPGFILTFDVNEDIKFLEEVVSFDDLPTDYKPSYGNHIHIKSTTTTYPTKSNYDMGWIDSMDQEPKVEVRYTTRPPTHISFEKLIQRWKVEFL